MNHFCHVVVVAVALSAPGCAYILGLEPPGSDGDSGPDDDSGLEPPDIVSCQEWSAVHFDPCAIESPGPQLLLTLPGRYIYDADLGRLTDPQGGTVAHTSEVITQRGSTSQARLISTGRVLVGGQTELRVVGSQPMSLPLIVASWSTIVIESSGAIDVSSDDEFLGAGYRDACPGGSQSGENNNGGGGGGGDGGGGGGGGGGFGTMGGRGGTGGGGANGGDGGQTAPASEVRGGCRGSNGGSFVRGASALGGAGGQGGGAVQLTAGRGVTVHGRISAHGKGGGGAPDALVIQGGDDGGGGGGGGGSGGYIGLDSKSSAITSIAFLAANGGGGGAAASYQDNDGRPGPPGAHGLDSTAGAQGGQVVFSGGSGGIGDALREPAAGGGLSGGTGSSGSGGGGGGGGEGYILTFGSDPTVDGGATLSPMVQSGG